MTLQMANGAPYGISCDPYDTIESVAANSHYTTHELCNILNGIAQAEKIPVSSLHDNYILGKDLKIENILIEPTPELDTGDERIAFIFRDSEDRQIRLIMTRSNIESISRDLTRAGL